jgi:hypothetical protein
MRSKKQRNEIIDKISMVSESLLGDYSPHYYFNTFINKGGVDLENNANIEFIGVVKIGNPS